MTTSIDVLETIKESFAEFTTQAEGKTKKSQRLARKESLALVKLLKQFKALNLKEEKEK